jgi:hypothetical protein
MTMMEVGMDIFEVLAALVFVMYACAVIATACIVAIGFVIVLMATPRILGLVRRSPIA